MNKELLLENLKKFYSEFGRAPKVADFKTCPYLISYSSYAREFGGLIVALKLADIPLCKNTTKTISKVELLETIKRFYTENGRTPTTLECANHAYLKAAGTYRKYFGSFDTAIEEAGLQKSPKALRYTDQELLDKLMEFYKINGKAPLKEECIKANNLPSYSTYIKRFGSFTDVLKKLNIPENSRPKIYSEEELIESLKRFGKEFNRSPTQEECVATHEYLFSADTYYKRFGSLNNAFETAGLEIRNASISVMELDLLAFIKENYKGEVKTNIRILDNKEIDIYLPELKIGFEFNGLYWHSETKLGNEYHLNKLNIATNKGIRLIQIFENEWINHQKIVKSRVLNLLGIAERIFARKCTIVEVDNADAVNFLNKNHVQGNAAGSIRLGLLYADELVAIMTFCKARFSQNYEWELLRYCNILNTSVVGGASKLFKYFIKIYKPSSIISYSDKRWNTGKLYTNLNFTYSHSSKPNYWYFKGKTLESRIKYQKHKLKNILVKFNENKTEYENMLDNGYDRIFDCGNDVFVYFEKNSS